MESYKPIKQSSFPVNTSPSAGDLVPSLVQNGSGGWENKNIPYESLKGDPGSPGADGQPGRGVPDGGTTSQVLQKKSNTDYDTQWTTMTLNKAAVGLSNVDNTSDLNKPVSTAVQDAISAAILQAKMESYPIGSTYFNKTNSTNPATLLGFGTWARLQGVVLGGRSETGGSPFNVAAGTVIGADTHTLTTAQIPPHRHDYKLNLNHSDGQVVTAEYVNASLAYGSARRRYTDATENAGGGESHNNIQRTLVGYLWERTA